MYTPKNNVPKTGAPAKRTQVPKTNTVQTKAQTGKGKSLPQGLKSGLENLSGMAMDDVQVHSNSAVPAQLQAEAFAQGSDIHLAPGKEKHLPHEVWHVVQQKQGKVAADTQTAGGIPVNTDRGLEQEADTMGHKAQNHTSIPQVPVKQTAAKQGVVQGYFLLDAEGIFMLSQQKRTAPTGKSFLKEGSHEANIKVGFEGVMRVSKNMTMAVEDGGGGSNSQTKVFYATSDVQNSANQKLAAVGSPIRLAANTSIAIQMGNNRLNLLYPVDLKSKTIGHRVPTPQRCNECGPYIGNTRDNSFLSPTYKTGNPHALPQQQTSHKLEIRLLGILPILLKEKKFQQNSLLWNFFETMLPTWRDETDDKNTLLTGSVPAIGEFLEKIGNGNELDGIKKLVKRYVKEFINAPGSKEIQRQIGINEFIDPKVGDVLSIRTLTDRARMDDNGDDFYVHDFAKNQEIKNPFEYHYATVIAKSGSDYVTMENYARPGEEGNKDHYVNPKDARFYFKMYGPEEQSFHSEQKDEYANPLTLRFSPDRQPKDYGMDIDSGSVKNQIRNYNKELNFYNSQR